jgi:hypothetical protein
MFFSTAERWIHLFARIILTCASQHFALILALSAMHFFVLASDGQSTRPSLK